MICRLIGQAGLCALVASALAGCASYPQQGEGVTFRGSPWAAQSTGHAPALPNHAPDAGWQHQAFPGKSPTRFNYARKDGRDALAVRNLLGPVGGP